MSLLTNSNYGILFSTITYGTDTVADGANLVLLRTTGTVPIVLAFSSVLWIRN